MDPSRVRPATVAAVVFATMANLGCPVAAATPPQPVELRWLDQSAPAISQGVSWGVPWAKGAIQKEQSFALTAGGGGTLPLQSWPLAYWPDGSIKWMGFATSAPAGTGGPLLLTAAATNAGQPAGVAVVKVQQSNTTYEIDTGPLKARIGKWGAGIIQSLVVDGREVGRDGRLVCILQDGPDVDPVNPPQRQAFDGNVETVTLEQSGPVRAVVRIEGRHKAALGGRSWLPFVVRLYFYAGQTSVRMVHTIVFDGDEQRDFIRGLGVVFAVPMREQVQNRQVRFSGEGGGLWSEPVQPMVGRGGHFVANPAASGEGARRSDVFPEQLAGHRVPNREQLDPRGRDLLADWAVWDGFKLVQPNADGFTVVKRTNAQSCWLPAGAGRRASGLVFVGDVSGGLAVGLKDFWQSYPASLEVENASTGEAKLTVWLWSPDAPAMDLRHYDTRAHGLDSVYEDVQEGFSSPVGIARTRELTLNPTAAIPAKSETIAQAQWAAQPPVLVCTPEYLHAAHAFGIWSLPDRSTPLKKAVEENLDSLVAYYENQVDVQHWYGFWDYGDVMHSYDAARHVWRYDLGGMAWDNSELGTDLWLWYSFLRTGRADIFRMAAAMTRQTGETDCYHLGRFAGLGSRHNVRHWGCGAKEARISQAAYRRFFYYLTTDERTGDLMHEVVNADYKAAEFDPMRLAQPITPAERKIAAARVRLGPDWFAFAGNWMTEWERTGDTKWRDKILAGVDSLSKMPYGLRSGRNLVYGYDPATGRLLQLTDQVGEYNLSTIMGGAEVVFELNDVLNDPRWDKLWLQYCRLYLTPHGVSEEQMKAVIAKDLTTGTEGADGAYLGVQQGGPRMAAYAYLKTKNPVFAKRAVEAAFDWREAGAIKAHRVAGPDVLNPFEESPFVSTNGTAQSALNAIEVLDLCADQLPSELPPPESGRGGPGRAGGERGAPPAGSRD
jgi:YetA-like protein